MNEKRTTVKRDHHQEHRAWKAKEMFSIFQSWIASDQKGTKQRKVRWNRSGVRRRSRRKRSARSIVRKRMTRLMMRQRRAKGQNARSGRRQR